MYVVQPCADPEGPHAHGVFNKTVLIDKAAVVAEFKKCT